MKNVSVHCSKVLVMPPQAFVLHPQFVLCSDFQLKEGSQVSILVQCESIESSCRSLVMLVAGCEQNHLLP